MDVWIATRTSENEIVAVFSSEQKYEAFLKSWKWEYQGDFSVEKFTLDEANERKY